MFIRGLLLMFAFLLASCTKTQNFDEKVLNLVAVERIKGFDPIQANDLYSSNEIARVYDGLYQYHYLKRPYELEPNLAASMPEVSKDGLTYKIQIKKGVLFHDDIGFKDSVGREVKAQDFVYSIKRLADAHNQSTGWWMLEGKLKGLDEWRQKYSKESKADYDEVIEGVQALDDYTIQFKLNAPFPQFVYALAMPFTYVVAKEIVDYYGKEFVNHPVGTGAFITQKFISSNRIVYDKNPKYRDDFYPTEGEAGDKDKGLLKHAGQKLPLVDKIIVNIQYESQPRWLAFEKGRADYLAIPKDNFDQVVTPDKGITDAFAKKGILLEITPDLDVTFIAFNHDNDLFKNNKKLRQAMSLAYDVSATNTLFYNNTAIPAQSLIPPGIAGHDEKFENPYAQFDLEKAKALLAEAGYPEGKGLPVIRYETVANTTSRQMAEFFKTQMSRIGINVEINSNTWPELQKKVSTRQHMMYGMGWGADYPDAENFLSLLYGPNASPGSNGSNYNNPEFNKIFEQAKVLQHSPERTALYDKLNKMAAEETPWIFGVHRTSFVVKHSWLENFKFTTFDHGIAKFLSVDLEKKKEIYPKL